MNPRAVPVRRSRADMRAELARLAAGRPPFVSIYLDVSPGPPRATATERLAAGLAALPGMTDAQRLLFSRPLPRPDTLDHDRTLAALVDADGQYLVTSYPQAPRLDTVIQANLPYLAPMLQAEQALTHHVVALVHNGTDNGSTRVVDVLTVPRHGPPAESSFEVEPGLTVAPFVHRICQVSRTTLLIVGAPEVDLGEVGDQIETGLPVETSVVRLAIDGLDQDGLDHELTRATATHAANRTVELLRLWRFHQSQGEAVTGAAETVAALRAGRAALVLVSDDPFDDRHAWFGSEPGRLALDMEQAAPIDGADRLLEGRLGDVVIRAALLTGCPVHVVPSVEDTLDDGMGVVVAHRADPRALTELLEL